MSPQKYTPLQDRIVAKVLAEKEAPNGGLSSSNSAAQERPITGEVLAVGRGRTLGDGAHAPSMVKNGDRILTAELVLRLKARAMFFSGRMRF
ncbi:uncharacterized protein DSM5745_09258 [Aspergillus mulundensis]|uniref:10 kDa heat shock protein, mitochondrial n=1 Tax=Aspergillus mulundensis TaxID=1810919 RepID=A0A3D8R007_9EURO|nr:hypothetical protein DSM5745_09258 [Aspergillus mulundensis]RDW67392.1 hypothetical protein DSM5745_09258 [Aspergillus mulundensis]